MSPNKNWQEKFSKSPSSSDSEEEGAHTLVLVRGADMQGQPQWAYALIPADHYFAFQEAEKLGNYSLADFGTVLHFGAGENPPEDVVREMTEHYGADPNFEAEILEEAQKAFDLIYAAFAEEASAEENNEESNPS